VSWLEGDRLLEVLVLGQLDGVLGEKGGCPSLVAGRRSF
jgi:hypothetical protein